MHIYNIKAIVFDLDGTLYEDIHHFDYYAERLGEKLSPDRLQKFIEDYHLVLANKHPLKIGRVYDVNNDLILVHENKVVTDAYHWNGNQLHLEDIKLKYGLPISLNMHNMLSIGDLWWVPSSIARHYGATKEQTSQAFLETREFMMSNQFILNPVEGLKETLEEISSRAHIPLILLTNSPESDSEAILKKLELSNLFHHKIFEAHKPTLTQKHFKQIRDTFNISYAEILSIGDNYQNDIAPAKLLGCGTLYIDPHRISNNNAADIIVHQIKEVISILKN